jgi:N-acetylglucosaminyldiphosphoundecaprenol N-acetyl-beta-D-mannosaminyltransferase
MSAILNRKKILKASITNASYNEILQSVIMTAKSRQSAYVCVANVHMVVEALKNQKLHAAMEQAWLTIPDGKPLSVFMNWIYGTHQERVTGPDLMNDIVQRAASEKIALYFYGSTDEVIHAVRSKLENDYPGVAVAGAYSPPFRELTAAEDDAIVQMINASNADILFVGLGCPKQEIWMEAHKNRIQAVMIGVGAAFPFFTGHLKRAPDWMQAMGLEWLYRFLKEPRRLFMRYVITNTIFLTGIHIQWFQHKMTNFVLKRRHEISKH